MAIKNDRRSKGVSEMKSLVLSLFGALVLLAPLVALAQGVVRP